MSIDGYSTLDELTSALKAERDAADEMVEFYATELRKREDELEAAYAAMAVMKDLLRRSAEKLEYSWPVLTLEIDASLANLPEQAQKLLAVVEVAKTLVDVSPLNEEGEPYASDVVWIEFRDLCRALAALHSKEGE